MQAKVSISNSADTVRVQVEHGATAVVFDMTSKNQVLAFVNSVLTAMDRAWPLDVTGVQ